MITVHRNQIECSQPPVQAGDVVQFSNFEMGIVTLAADNRLGIESAQSPNQIETAKNLKGVVVKRMHHEGG